MAHFIYELCKAWCPRSFDLNPLKPSFVIWLHFECSAPQRPNLPISISGSRALWRSELSARVTECQKSKMAG